MKVQIIVQDDDDNLIFVQSFHPKACVHVPVDIPIVSEDGSYTYYGFWFAPLDENHQPVGVYLK